MTVINRGVADAMFEVVSALKQHDATINQALLLYAEHFERDAKKAHALANEGVSDGLVYDYRPVAEMFEQVAQRARAARAALEGVLAALDVALDAEPEA